MARSKLRGSTSEYKRGGIDGRVKLGVLDLLTRCSHVGLISMLILVTEKTSSALSPYRIERAVSGRL